MRPLASLLLVILVAGFDDVVVVRGALLAALDFVHGSLHVVVDATLGDTRQRLERSRMLIGQHLVPLAGMGHHPEGPAGT